MLSATFIHCYPECHYAECLGNFRGRFLGFNFLGYFWNYLFSLIFHLYTHTHTHTHARHYISFSHTYPTLYHIYGRREKGIIWCVTFSLSYTITLSPSLSHTHTHTHTIFHLLSLTLSLSRTHIHTNRIKVSMNQGDIKVSAASNTNIFNAKLSPQWPVL
jgi:hypothetical protein